MSVAATRYWGNDIAYPTAAEPEDSPDLPAAGFITPRNGVLGILHGSEVGSCASHKKIGAMPDAVERAVIGGRTGDGNTPMILTN